MKKHIWLILVLLFCALCSFVKSENFWVRYGIFSQKHKVIFNQKFYKLLSDNNIHKFVWVKQPFKDISYEPEDLVPLQWRSHISAQAKHTFRLEAANHLEKMASDFYETFWTNIVIASAYRSYSYQKNSISESCKQSWRCAREWESEHQLWLAVDLWEASSESKFLSKYQKYYDWLHNNAHLYWFHQSYQNWREIDWYYIEPRHRRYLWVNLATKLHEKNITFTQYVSQSY